MRRNLDLVGQTITGVIARRGKEGDPRTIYLLQLGDGSCVEFVTPDGARALRRAARGPRAQPQTQQEPGPRQWGLALDAG